MKKNPALFSYRNCNSLVHKIPAWIKLVLLCVVSVRTFSNSKGFFAFDYIFWLRATFYFIFTLVLFFAAKTPFSSIKKLRFVFVLGAILCIFGLVGQFTSGNKAYLDSFLQDVLYVFRFFITSLMALVVFESTSRLQILEVFENLEKLISKIFPFAKKLNFSLILSVTVTFIPEIFSAWNELSFAARARKPLKNKNLLKAIFLNVYDLNARFSALFFNMIQYAEQVRRALQNRLS